MDHVALANIRPGFYTVVIDMVFCQILFPEIRRPSDYEMYFSSISTFLNFLMLKFQAMDNTPFDTHPKTMAAAVFSFMLLVYSIRFDAGSYSALNGIRVGAVSSFVWLFWASTLASLSSLLLPDSIRPFLYMLCFAPLLFELLRSFCGRVRRRFEEWCNAQRIRILQSLAVDRRRIPRLPV